VRSALKSNSGIENVKTDVHNHTIKITFDNSKINLEKIKRIIEDKGFKVVK